MTARDSGILFVAIASVIAIVSFWPRRDARVPPDAAGVTISTTLIRNPDHSTRVESNPRTGLAIQRLDPVRIDRLTEATHALRLWGFAKGRALSLLTDSTIAEQNFGFTLHRKTRFGIEFVHETIIGPKGELHNGQVLNALADAGVPSDLTIYVGTDSLTVASIVRNELANTSCQDIDLPFEASGLCRYVPLNECWRNKHGEELSFNVITRELCSRPYGTGHCYGTHTLYAIALIIAIDDRQQHLDLRTRELAVKQLKGASAFLMANQRANGSWDPGWYLADASSTETSENEHLGSIVVTSHSLEWLAFSRDTRMSFDDPSVLRACAFLEDQILRASAESIAKHYCPFSHAANALRLWSPDSFDQMRGD